MDRLWVNSRLWAFFRFFLHLFAQKNKKYPSCSFLRRYRSRSRRASSRADDHCVSRRVRRAPHAHGESSRDARDVRGFRARRVRLRGPAHEPDHRGRFFPRRGSRLFGFRIGRAIDRLDGDAIASPRRSFAGRSVARKDRLFTVRAYARVRVASVSRRARRARRDGGPHEYR